MPEDDNLHSTDKALLQAVATGEGTVELTPDVMAQIASNLTARTTDIARRYPDLVLHCPYETRLAVVAWAMQHIVEHARDGGSFRYLIYERLGFGPEAYVPLYEAGGMEISNEFHLGGHDEEVTATEAAEQVAKAVAQIVAGDFDDAGDETD